MHGSGSHAGYRGSSSRTKVGSQHGSKRKISLGWGRCLSAHSLCSFSDLIHCVVWHGGSCLRFPAWQLPASSFSLILYFLPHLTHVYQQEDCGIPHLSCSASVWPWLFLPDELNTSMGTVLFFSRFPAVELLSEGPAAASYPQNCCGGGKRCC